MTERALGSPPDAVPADAGYRTEAVLETLADIPFTVIVALGHEARDRARIDAVRYPHTARIAQRINIAEGQPPYRRCKAIVEVTNDWIKSVLGFRQFTLRGVEKVRAE